MKQPSFSLGRRAVSPVNIKSLAAASCMLFSSVQQLFQVPEFWNIKSEPLLRLARLYARICWGNVWWPRCS